MEKKYVVPEGMLQCAVEAMKEPGGSKFRSTEQWAATGLEAAIRWLAENPIVPTKEQIDQIDYFLDGEPNFVESHAVEWQRRMFLAPEPEAPDAVKDLYDEAPPGGTAQKAIIEAYRRGQNSK
jgi:hypothetical protein